MAGNGVREPAEPVEQSLGVSHVMGLVDHQQIDERLPMARFVEKPRKLVPGGARLAFALLRVIVPTAGWAEPLHAADEGVAASGVLRSSQRTEKLFRIPNLGLNTEAACQLVLPLLAQRLGTSDQEAIAIEPRTQLGPDEARLNGLAEPHLVGDQHRVGGRTHQLDNRLELVGVEVGFRRLHAVDDVTKPSSHPKPGQGTAEPVGLNELAACEAVDEGLGCGGNGLEGVVRQPFDLPVGEPHLHHSGTSNGLVAFEQDAGTSRISFQTNERIRKNHQAAPQSPVNGVDARRRHFTRGADHPAEQHGAKAAAASPKDAGRRNTGAESNDDWESTSAQTTGLARGASGGICEKAEAGGLPESENASDARRRKRTIC